MALGVLDARTALGVWEDGEREHPIDRALTILAALCGEPRAALAALPLNRRDALLLRARVAAFGPVLEAVAACERCGCEIEVTVRIAGADAEPDADHGRLEAGASVAYRVPDSFDLAAIARCPDLAAAERALRERCISSERPLDEAALAAAERELERLSASSSVALELTCPDCAAVAAVALDPGAFFWSEIAAYARRVIDDVDALAARYGWSEAEILALSPARRARYLEYAG